MKFIGKLIVWLLVALLIVILAFYFLLQTRWGAREASRWITQNTGYQVAFDAMDHRFSSPSHILLLNVTFGRDGKPATLVAKTVDIGLSSRQITDPLHVDTILLQDGTLNIAPSTAPFPLAADRLILGNMAVNSPENGWNLNAQRVSGSIAPWIPQAGDVLGKKTHIQANTGSLTLNGVPAANAVVEGDIDNGVITLTTLNADIARGSLAGNARRNADGSWVVDNLRLNAIRLQSDKTLIDFFAPLSTVPSLQIGRLDVTDARLQGPDWAVTDLNLNVNDLTLSQGGWQSPDGKLSINASEFIYGSLHLLNPLLNTELSDQGIALRQFNTRWEGSTVSASGFWLRNGQSLTLDDASVSGLEYTLPKNWKQLWMDPLPEWLNSVTLKKFSVSRNLLIDIDPDFPWQVTSLEGNGVDLQLAKDRLWGVWAGHAQLNAAAATFNRTDIQRPSLALAANSSTINISEMNAFTDKGSLKATATVSQLPQRQVNVSLDGRGVPVNLLQAWGWPELPISGDGNIQLTASGNVQADAPLKPSVNGQLSAVNTAKQQVTQTMRGGVPSP